MTGTFNRKQPARSVARMHPQFAPSAPTLDQLEAELARVQHRSRHNRVLRNTLYALVAVIAVAILAATLWLPVLRISGISMTPTLAEGQVVVSVKGPAFEPGDVVALSYGGRILVKRVIAGPGDWVDIDENGTVSVNDERLDEPYVSEPARGKCDISLPCQVPDGRYFVMGDRRATSVDSRSSSVGCIDGQDVVGKIVFRVWPLGEFGLV